MLFLKIFFFWSKIVLLTVMSAPVAGHHVTYFHSEDGVTSVTFLLTGLFGRAGAAGTGGVLSGLHRLKFKEALFSTYRAATCSRTQLHPTGNK